MFWDKEKIEIQIASDIGNIRKIQQDNFYCMKKVLTNNIIEHYRDTFVMQPPAIFAICDGMGGESEGEAASYIASSAFETIAVNQLARMSDKSLGTFFEKNLREISDRIYRINRKKGAMISGTTIVLFYIDYKRICIANVGDSAAFLINNQEMQMITVLDNQAQSLYRRGLLSEEERWKDRRKRYLIQFLGMDSESMSFVPHIAIIRHKRKRITGLLCSDGLLDGMHPGEILNEILEGEDNENCVQKLIERAKDNGSRDNLTAMIIKYGNK